MDTLKSKSISASIGLAVAIGLIGTVGGSILGFIPGAIAFRTSPGGYGIFVDSFLLIESAFAVLMTVFLSAAHFGIENKTRRIDRARITRVSVFIPVVTWFVLSAMSGFNSFRIGGWFFGALIGLIALLCFEIYQRLMRRAELNESAGFLD